MSDTQRKIRKLIGQIEAICLESRPICLMEVCGTHTVSLFRSGIKSLLPDSLRLISGPGCPVCVTSQGYINVACELAGRDEVTICTYGDMVRVPGSNGSLEQQSAEGASVVVVYSARDAVAYAVKHPDRQVVFLAVGFETTAPATAAAVMEAKQKKLDNFFVLPGHKLVIPAMQMLLSAGEVAIDGFMCPGHVSVVIGTEAYRPIVEEFGKPCVITGFEPEKLLQGILLLVKQVAEDRAEVENAYDVAVSEKGNPLAWQMIEKVFYPAAAVWRAIGEIPESGLELRDEFKAFDALEHFGIEPGPDEVPPGCLCGEVIQGKATPPECKLFGTKCTPMNPVGPCMVSSEGTCAAWFKYKS